MGENHTVLTEMLKQYVHEINEYMKGYHATIDKSGATPQLIISEKKDAQTRFYRT